MELTDNKTTEMCWFNPILKLKTNLHRCIRVRINSIFDNKTMITITIIEVDVADIEVAVGIMITIIKIEEDITEVEDIEEKQSLKRIRMNN